MTNHIPLSALAAVIRESVETIFGQQTFWVIAETADVKKYAQKRWCFLKLIEKDGADMVCEMYANIWSNAYNSVQRFEKVTGKEFSSGLQIACQVKVVFHERFGLRLEVVQVDAAYTHGLHEMQKQQTIERLVKTYPNAIQMVDGELVTFNQRLKAPRVWQRIALVAAANSDGYRDFMRELETNPQGFYFQVQHFAVQVQGTVAAQQIAAALQAIHPIASNFDVVAIVRGGGSDTDFSPFDDFEVARSIALFPIPVVTGIGHDRNITIADMMGWPQKTPTKAAAVIVDSALRFASELMQVSDTLQDIYIRRIQTAKTALQQAKMTMHWLVPRRLERRQQHLAQSTHILMMHASGRIRTQWQQLQLLQSQIQHLPVLKLHQTAQQLKGIAALVKEASPEKILSRGFAMVMQEDKLITDAAALQTDKPLLTILKNAKVISDIKSIET